MEACWVAQDERAHLAAVDAADAEDEALAALADDAADELLTEDDELLLHIADDTPRGHQLMRYHQAWVGTRLRDGLTCEEIVEACIWSPGGADLRGAMTVLRERLRASVQRKYAPMVDGIARKLLAAQIEEAAS